MLYFHKVSKKISWLSTNNDKVAHFLLLCLCPFWHKNSSAIPNSKDSKSWEANLLFQKRRKFRKSTTYWASPLNGLGTPVTMVKMSCHEHGIRSFLEGLDHFKSHKLQWIVGLEVRRTTFSRSNELWVNYCLELPPSLPNISRNSGSRKHPQVLKHLTSFFLHWNFHENFSYRRTLGWIDDLLEYVFEPNLYFPIYKWKKFR